jgi:hypothetical protein
MNEDARPLYSYFGIRESGETMWGLEKLPISPYEISGALKNDWRDISEWILIGEYEEQERLDKAMRDERPSDFVWIINPRIKEWNKWDVPVGLADTRWRIRDIAWKVLRFRHNRVKLELRVEEDAIIIWGDELLCDPFPQLCLLASHVEHGKECIISLENGWSYFYEFHARNTDDHNSVFFMARAHGALDGDRCEFLYLRVERERFVAALRAMLEEAAEHPDLVHHYLMDISDDDALDKASKHAVFRRWNPYLARSLDAAWRNTYLS